jgi:hypothetical protein
MDEQATPNFTSTPLIPRYCYRVIDEVYAVYFSRQKEPMDHEAGFGNQVLPVYD